MSERGDGRRARRAALASCLAFSAILALGLAACSDADLCGNEIVADVVSPSGARHAIVFLRDCGATTGFSTQLSILPAGEALPEDGGNAVILDDRVPLTVQWVSETELLVKGAGSKVVFRHERSVADVRVRVEP